MSSVVRQIAGNKWIYCPAPRKDPRVRVFCFPYAGGSPLIFRTWPDALPDTVEVMAVRLPGHDSRIRELAFTEWDPLLETIEQALSEYLDLPFVLFGHSLGASIAYELAQRMQRSQRSMMHSHLVVSGRRCPHMPSCRMPMHHLPQQEFFERLRQMNGILPEVLENTRLMAVLEPSIRADIKLAETWKGTTETPLDVPITALSGALDDIDSTGDMQGWTRYSSIHCSLITLPGGHFFIHTAELQILEILAGVVDCIQR